VTKPQSEIPARRLYGRSKGAKMRARPLRLMEELYPELAVDVAASIDPSNLFGRKVPELWFEVGFGKGEHLIAQAQAHPQAGLIGAEPFLNGMAACVGLVEDTAVQNVRLYRGDALDVLEKLPDQSLSRVFILHPDPWPKFRHAKRRFVNNGPLDIIAAKMKPGAELRIGTDHPVYLAHTLQVMQGRADFIWQAETLADWSARPADWPDTRYEQWSLGEDRPVWYLRYLRAL
jgi:tRNA (guanine-N7-)-methyltransferase